MTTWHSFDGGFGNTKAIVNGKEIIFSNLVGNHNPGNSLSGSETPLSIIVDGVGQWNFGRTALHQSTSPRRPQDNDRIFSPEYLGALLLAISEGYSDQTRDIECSIMTGFPGTDFGRLENNPVLKGEFKRRIVGEHKIQRPGYRQKITVKNAVKEDDSIRYTRQGWGAIWKSLITEQGQPVKFRDIGNANEIRLGCINVGYNTLEGGEVVVSRLNSNELPMITPVEGRQLSITQGVHTIVPRLIDDLATRYNKTFGPEQAISILEAKGLILDGKWQEYTLPDSIRNELAETVWSAVTNVWQGGTYSLYRLILTGGGANIVKDRFANIPQVVVSDKPVFDTARGYLHLAKMVFKGK